LKLHSLAGKFPAAQQHAVETVKKGLNAHARYYHVTIINGVKCQR